MGRLIPAGTGLAYYRRVKIAGEDIVEEEPIQEADPLMEGIPGYDEEARTLYAGGLSEDTSAPWGYRGPGRSRLHRRGAGRHGFAVLVELRASPFGGYLGDRVSRGRLIVGSLAGWSLITLLSGFAVAPWQLLAMRVALGLVEALYIPAAFVCRVSWPSDEGYRAGHPDSG